MSGIVFMYSEYYNIISLGNILISHLVVADLFMDSLSGNYDSTLLGCALFYTKGVFA